MCPARPVLPSGGRRSAPRDPPPTEGGAGRARYEAARSWPTLLLQAPSYISYILRLLTPLFFSPREAAHSAGPTLKSFTGLWLGVFFRFFWLPKRTSIFASKKHRKQCENLGFRPPKTLAKPHPKPFQIDVPKNT